MSYKNLKIWQLTRELVIDVHKMSLTQQFYSISRKKDIEVQNESSTSNIKTLKFRYKYISCIFFFFYCLLPHSYCQLDSSGLDTTIIYSSLEEALKNPKNVYRLHLKRKKLTEFPREIIELINLQELNLSRNKIYELSREIGVLTNLQVLNVSKNKLQTIPAEIGKLKQLTQLILFQNEINSLPSEIGELKNLQFLDIWGNEIIEFPQELSELKNLKVLDVRVIEMNKNRQNVIKELLPHTKIYFSNSCNCAD